MDHRDGSIIEFPLKNISKVYRVIKLGDRWQEASNFPYVRHGGPEEVVVLQFLHCKIAFSFPTVDETQRFMLCIGLSSRRAKEKYIINHKYAISCGSDSELHCG